MQGIVEESDSNVAHSGGSTTRREYNGPNNLDRFSGYHKVDSHANKDTKTILAGP